MTTIASPLLLALSGIKDLLSFPLANLSCTEAAVAFFDEQVERKAQRLKRRRLSSEQTNVGGVAEAVLRHIDPELIERARDCVAEIKTLELSAAERQDQVQHQERSKQHQKKRAKVRDQGMEL